MSAPDQAILYVEWDDGHTSPPVGPYRNITEANKDATAMRKALKANGHPFRRVRTGYLRSRAEAWSWNCFTPRLEVIA